MVFTHRDLITLLVIVPITLAIEGYVVWVYICEVLRKEDEARWALRHPFEALTAYLQYLMEVSAARRRMQPLTYDDVIHIFHTILRYTQYLESKGYAIRRNGTVRGGIYVRRSVVEIQLRHPYHAESDDLGHSRYYPGMLQAWLNGNEITNRPGEHWAEIKVWLNGLARDMADHIRQSEAIRLSLLRTEQKHDDEMERQERSRIQEDLRTQTQGLAKRLLS